MTDINPSHARHRPPPLTTDQRPPSSDRAHMLQGLRTARPSPLPVSSPNPNNPLSALQRAQADYLQQLQLQIQQQSQMLLMQQQQQSEVAFREMQRRAAARDQQQQQQQQGRRASQQRSSSVEPQRRQQQQVYAEPPKSAVVGGSFLSPEEEEVATTNSKTNPLVASALARRKRQSLNAEAMGALQSQGAGRERRISSGPADVVHHRQSSSETTASSASACHTSPPSSVSARTPPASADPPALILSKPGEAYPSTSGSEDDDDDSTSSIKSKPQARRYSVHTAADLTSPKASSSGSDSPDLSAEAQDAVAAKPTRRSHVSDLNLALGGRKQRPAAISGAGIGLGSPQLAGGFGDTPRASSDSHTPILSPFATTFTPLPPSPYFPSPAPHQMSFASPPLAGGVAFSPQQMFSPQMNAFSPSMNAFSPNMSTPFSPTNPAYQSNKPAALAGTASAIRQPRGPAAELAGNFSSRLRRRAVATLLGSRGVGRVSLGGGGEGEGGAVMGLGVEVAGAEE